MAFLTINGIDIDVLDDGQVSYEDIGDTVRAFDGTLIRDRRAIKRKWKFRTPPLASDVALSIVGLVQGTGHFWKFDGTSDPIEAGTSTNTASSSGLVASTRTGTTIHRTTAEDGDSVANLHTAPATAASVAQRTGAIGIYATSENELLAAERNCEGTPSTAFTAYGTATLADETTEIYAGTKSLKCTANAPNDGYRTSGIGAAPAEVWTGSVYLKGASGGETVTVKVFDNSSGVTPKDVTLSATEWRRVWVTHTVVAGATTVYMSVRDSSGVDVWYADNFQLEESAFPTAWVDGARASADVLRYSATWLQRYDSFTFSCWSNGAGTNSSFTNRIFELGDGTTNNRIIFGWASTTGYLRALVYKNNLVQGDSNNSTAHTYGVWYHVACVYDLKAGTLKAYRNGALAFTLTGLSLALDSLTIIGVGCSSQGTAPVSGEIDDAFIVPYAMTSGQIAEIYNSGSAVAADIPNLVCSGDFIGDETVICKGNVTGTAYRQIHQSTGWTANSRSLSFELEEV